LFPYWLLFAYFAAGTLLHRDKPRRAEDSYPLLAIGALLIALMIGFRYQVGGDWFAYQRMFSFAQIATFDQIIALGDPGYQLLNWLGQQIGGEIWVVNLLCGAIFAWGLLAFARVQPLPWLAILVAVPYLVIVVAMGYSRQGVAIGILMAGLARMTRGGTTFKFILYVVAAALFHRTAIVMLPLVILSVERNRILNLVLALALGFVLYDFFLSSATDRFVTNYIRAAYNAQGAAIRVVMSVIPATLFLFNQRRFGFDRQERKLWRNFSLAAFLFLLLLILLPSSAAVDRLALYVMPLQIAVLSRIPLAYRSNVAKFLILLYAFAVQFVWLNYADNASAWVPYRLYFFSE
jgi:hypothetical protein